MDVFVHPAFEIGQFAGRGVWRGLAGTSVIFRGRFDGVLGACGPTHEVEVTQTGAG
jgi:hypothetical protein